MVPVRRAAAAAVGVDTGIPPHRWVPRRVGEAFEAVASCGEACGHYGAPLCSRGRFSVVVVCVDFVLGSTRRHEMGFVLLSILSISTIISRGDSLLGV